MSSVKNIGGFMARWTKRVEVGGSLHEFLATGTRRSEARCCLSWDSFFSSSSLLGSAWGWRFPDGLTMNLMEGIKREMCI